MDHHVNGYSPSGSPDGEPKNIGPVELVRKSIKSHVANQDSESDTSSKPVGQQLESTGFAFVDNAEVPEIRPAKKMATPGHESVAPFVIFPRPDESLRPVIATLLNTNKSSKRQASDEDQNKSHLRVWIILFYFNLD